MLVNDRRNRMRKEDVKNEENPEDPMEERWK